MLGKTASSLFWMARYLERAENQSRLIEAGFRMALTRWNTAAAEWRSILVTAGADQGFAATHNKHETSNVVDYLLRDPSNHGSILCMVKLARDNARTARTALTREVWEAVNSFWMTITQLLKKRVPDEDLPDVLKVIRQCNAQVRGAINGTMLRDDGFHYAMAGGFLERADNTARILDVKYYLLLPSVAHIGGSMDMVQWDMILRSVSAHSSFRWTYGSDVSALLVADFLILNEKMPRSLAYCHQIVRQSLVEVERGYGRDVEKSPALALANAQNWRDPIDVIFENGLHQYLRSFLSANAALAGQIERDYRFAE
jgi:uncharacterized alpha-E superfamily protein